MHEFVAVSLQLTVGYGQFENGKFCHRYKSSRAVYGGSVHIKIHKADSTPKDILRMAIWKFKQEDQNFPARESHGLVYQDEKSLYTAGSEAPPMLPDRKTAFSIQQYRWWKKTAYDRLKLFLVKTGNFQLIFASCSFFLQVVTFFLQVETSNKKLQLFFASKYLLEKGALFSCKCRLAKKSCNCFLQVSTCKKKLSTFSCKLPTFLASVDFRERVATFFCKSRLARKSCNFFLQVSTCKKKLQLFSASLDLQEKVATFFYKSRLARKSCPLFLASCPLFLQVSTSKKELQLFSASLNLLKKVATFFCKSRLARKSCPLFLASYPLFLASVDL